MAHGTGKYLERVYKADIEKEHIKMYTSRVYNYYFEPYSDSYEPDCEALDDFEIELYKIETKKEVETKHGKWGDMTTTITRKKVVDKLEIRIKDKNVANYIWYLVKYDVADFEQIKEMIETNKFK